jgi:hypothetical protein
MEDKVIKQFNKDIYELTYSQQVRLACLLLTHVKESDIDSILNYMVEYIK